jgi:hypothetical protein
MVGRDEGDQEGRDPHQQQGRDQRRLAPDPVAVMAKDRRPDRPRDKADGVDRKRLQCPDQRVRLREIQLRENQPRDGAVDEEIVPFDRRADRAGDHRAAQLGAMLVRGKAVGCGAGGGHRALLPSFRGPVSNTSVT